MIYQLYKTYLMVHKLCSHVDIVDMCVFPFHSPHYLLGALESFEL